MSRSTMWIWPGAPVGEGEVACWTPIHPQVPPPHTHSTKLPMAARGLQETYRSRLRFSALRTARITLESEEAQIWIGIRSEATQLGVPSQHPCPLLSP